MTYETELAAQYRLLAQELREVAKVVADARRKAELLAMAEDHLKHAAMLEALGKKQP